MVYVGMDVHQKSTTFCFFDPDREAVAAVRHIIAGAHKGLEPFKGECRVAYEVGTQAQWVAGVVRPLAAEVQVANPSKIPWLFRDRTKTDRYDARKLATLLFLDQIPQVHLPSPDVSAWRALINHRRTLVKRRTMSKNQVRNILRAFACRCPYRSCWYGRGYLWLTSVRLDDVRDLMLRHLLEDINDLNKRMAAVEASLDTIASDHPHVKLLQTIPGIGPRTAEALVAFTDQVGRFRNRKRFASYFGMTPKEDSSGLVRRHGRISKRGPSVVRWVLIEGAHSAIRHCPALRRFYRQVEHGRSGRKKRAIVAVGRKMLNIAYGMMRDGTPFDESRVMRAVA